MSSVSAPSNVRNAAPTQSTQAAEESEIPKGPWRDLLAQDMANQKEAGFLSDDRMSAYKGNVEKAMEEFVAKNPEADEKEINAELKKQMSSNYGHEMLGQMQFNYFVKKLESRAKEISQDMWK